VVLVVPDELSLGWLCDDASAAGLRVVRFHEPDLDGSLTASALEPVPDRSGRCASARAGAVIAAL
jgi:hypothetical protein